MTTRVEFQTAVADLYTQISTLLPDNTVGDISPQDLRDVVNALNALFDVLSIEVQNWTDGP